MIKVMYKIKEEQLLVVAGHFTKEELFLLKQDGYRLENSLENKNGILIA